MKKIPKSIKGRLKAMRGPILEQMGKRTGMASKSEKKQC